MDELPVRCSGGSRRRSATARGSCRVRAMERASAEMHEVAVEAGDGTPHRLVLRRYADRSRLGTDPFYDPANEALVLRLLEETDVPAPRLLAADLGPDVCDVPALLESWMPGAPARPRDVDGYLRSAAEELVGSTRRCRGAEGLPDYVPYAVAGGLELRPPAWTTRPGLWERVLEVVDAEPPGTRDLLHPPRLPPVEQHAERLGRSASWRSSTGRPPPGVLRCSTLVRGCG